MRPVFPQQQKGSSSQRPVRRRVTGKALFEKPKLRERRCLVPIYALVGDLSALEAHGDDGRESSLSAQSA